MMGRLSATAGGTNAGRFMEATEPDPTRSLTRYVTRRAFGLSSFIRLGLDAASCPESVCPETGTLRPCKSLLCSTTQKLENQRRFCCG